MSKVALITGTSNGVGKATALKFLENGIKVIGLDICGYSIKDENYKHYFCDVSNYEQLPEINGINYIVNNAGITTPKKDTIQVNQIGYINVIKKYAEDPLLKSIVNVGDTGSDKGYNSIECCSSQGARNAITKWAANNYGKDDRHVLVNSLNIDGVDSDSAIDSVLANKIADLSILKRLVRASEIADWIYFLAVVNTCATSQIISIDGEQQGAYNFIKYPGWEL